ncbi:MAG: hypothetical protein WCG87_09355 [Bacteroidota bacterium]
MKKALALIIFLLFSIQGECIIRYEVSIVKGNKKLALSPNRQIGLVTRTDSVRYFDGKIISLKKDSIIILAPKYKDQVNYTLSPTTFAYKDILSVEYSNNKAPEQGSVLFLMPPICFYILIMKHNWVPHTYSMNEGWEIRITEYFVDDAKIERIKNRKIEREKTKAKRENYNSGLPY